MVFFLEIYGITNPKYFIKNLQEEAVASKKIGRMLVLPRVLKKSQIRLLGINLFHAVINPLVEIIIMPIVIRLDEMQ